MNKNIRNNLLYFIIPLIGILVFKYFSTKPSVDQISINYNTVQNKGNKTTNISYQAVNFNFDVKPILSDKCYTCHGPDDKARKANLRLDIEQGFYAALEDNPNHFVIDKNNPNESEILKRKILNESDGRKCVKGSKLLKRYSKSTSISYSLPISGR